MQELISMLDAQPRTSSVAADTGSAAHLAVANYHKGCSPQEAVSLMREALPTFPKADLATAERYFTLYSQDPRNKADVVVDCEGELRFTIPCHPWDSTGRPITCTGHYDQVRRGRDSIHEVWDYKTGEPDGWKMLHMYASQLAGYRQGLLSKYPGLRVGGIIRARGYIKRERVDPATEPGGVFFHATMTEPQCNLILNRVRLAVASIRNRDLQYGPGEHCSYCPHEGLASCTDAVKLQSLGIKEIA